MIPMRSATTSSSAAFAPSSRQDRTAPRRSATTSGFIVSATASSGHSATSRSTAPSPHDTISSPIASLECYISQPRVTGSNLSTRPSYLCKVVSGTVRTFKAVNNGRRQIRAFYLPGDIFGVETGPEHAFSAEAIIEAKLLVIERKAVVALAARDNDVARQLWSLTSRELRHSRNHVLLLIQSAQERVVGFLLEMADRVSAADEIELPMPRQDIADYLGLTIETVSRMMTHLEKKLRLRCRHPDGSCYA